MKTIFFATAFSAIIINTGVVADFHNTASLPFKTGVRELQIIPAFDFFRTHRQGKAGVTATWGLTSNTGVVTFIVEKTYEDPADPAAFWETVSVLPSSNERSYKYTDSNVFPGYISYRVTAFMGNGDEMISWVSTVHIVSH